MTFKILLSLILGILLFNTAQAQETKEKAIDKIANDATYPYPHLQIYFRLSLRDCMQYSTGLYAYFIEMQKKGLNLPTALVLEESKRKEYSYLLKDLPDVLAKYPKARVIYSDSLSRALSEEASSTFHI